MLALKFRIEHFIILVLVALLLLDGCQRESDQSTTKTSVTNKIIQKRDSSTDTRIKNRIPEKVSVIEHKDSIQRITNLKDVPFHDLEKIKEVNRYRDTTYFEGSRIFSDILAEGRILEKNIVVEVDHLETTITTEKTTIKQVSGFFLSPALSYSPVSGFESVEANLTYINKGNFGLSAGAFYNFPTNHTGFKLTIHKKIW